jgi:hypothetical protein
LLKRPFGGKIKARTRSVQLLFWRGGVHLSDIGA